MSQIGRVRTVVGCLGSVAVARVLHVVERYLDLSSGFVHSQISRSRHESVVLSRYRPEYLDAFALPELRRVPALVGGASWIDPRIVRSWVLRFAQRSGVSLAHAHFGYALAYTRILARRADIPVVTSLHGHDATAWPREAAWAYAPDPGLVSAVIVPSAWLATRVVELGFAADRVHVIPSGVDATFFTPTPVPDGPPVVGFVGRLVEKKGVDVLMAAWPRVRAAVPDAMLRVVGAGPLAWLVAGDGVSLTAPDPARRASQVRELIASSTVMTAPSHTAANGDAETLLLVNLEAQASGRAVVTTRHGGIAEYVADNETALVIPEASVDALVDALVSVLRDRGLATRLGQAGPALAGRYDVAAMAARVDDLYDLLLRSRST